MGEPRSTGNRPQSEALKDHRSHAFDKPQRQGPQQTTEDTESTEVCLCNSSVSSVSSVVCSKPFSVPSVGLFKPFSVPSVVCSSRTLFPLLFCSRLVPVLW